MTIEGTKRFNISCRPHVRFWHKADIRCGIWTLERRTFFDQQLPQIMKEVPPLPGEEKFYEWINGVLDAAAKDPEVMKTLRETAFAADEELIQPMTIAIAASLPATVGPRRTTSARSAPTTFTVPG